MLVQEQKRVLIYLGQRATAPFQDVLRACLPGAPLDWGKRVLADLEWLGYVTIYADGAGKPFAVQLTEKGRGHHLQGVHRPNRFPSQSHGA
jgi:hypothetical protein